MTFKQSENNTESESYISSKIKESLEQKTMSQKHYSQKSMPKKHSETHKHAYVCNPTQGPTMIAS